MKLNIKSISILGSCVAILSIMIGLNIAAPVHSADSGSACDLREKLQVFSQQGIMFYDPCECEEASSTNSCGNSAEEIYWSALSKTFSKEVAAGIMGNILNEGDFNPVSVESCTQYNPFDFGSKVWKPGWSWESYFNDNSKTTGVGAFGMTSARSEYLHYVQEKAPNLMQYFQHPELYSLGGCNGAPSAGGSSSGGEALRKLIGDADYSQLVTLEVEYLNQYLDGLNKQYGDSFFDLEKFKAMTDAAEAAEYFSMHAERCNGCLTAGSSENQERRSAAQKVYDEYKEFTCSSNGVYVGKAYNYDDTELRKIVAAAKTENSCSIYALKTEMSQMANLTEHDHYSSVGAAITGGWYAPAARSAYASGAGVTDEELEAARDVIKNGNRTVPPEVVEHDCINCSAGINYYSNDGVNFIPTTESSKSEFIQGKTILKQGSGGLSGQWVFWSFADPNGGENGGPCGDPFGFFEGENPTATASSGSSSSSSGSATTNSKVAPAQMTIIGDSISVFSESVLKQSFPDAYMNMVGSRHATLSSRCNDDAGGALAVLKTLASGQSGTIATEGASGCSTENYDSSSLKDTVIWEIGTNSVGAIDSLPELIKTVGGNRKLYLVTPHSIESTAVTEATASVAEAYRKAASENDNVFVIEWANAVKDKESQYLVDGTHPNEEGQKLLADLISKATASSEVCSSSDVNLGNFEWYTQWEEPWKNVSFGASTVGRAGCGPTSFAMMASILLGHSVTPEETAKVAVDTNSLYNNGLSGSNENLTKNLAEHFGLEYEAKPWSSAEGAVTIINDYLKNGWMVHVSGAGSDPFTSGGHYIGIIGITSDGKWQIVNSAVTEESRDKTYDPLSLVLAGLHYDIKAIRATGSTGSSGAACNNICEGSGGSSDSSNGLVSGGMNLAQAEEFMKQYKDMSKEDYDKALEDGTIYLSELDCCPNCGDGKPALANCTVFSRWFIQTYTTKRMSLSDRASGGATVDMLHYNLGLPTGKEPKPYAIFSKSAGGQWSAYGHTGVVLGVDEANDKIIIGEAGCLFSSDAYTYTGAKEKKLSEWKDGTTVFAYTDDILKLNK